MVRAAGPRCAASAPRYRAYHPRLARPVARPFARSAKPFARCPVRADRAAHSRRRHAVRGLERIRAGHGPPPDRLEGQRAPHQALRPRERKRAQQPDRVRLRLRTGDVRTRGRPAASRPGGIRRADRILRRTEGRRSGCAVRLCAHARRHDAVRRRSAPVPPFAGGGGRAGLPCGGTQFHAGAGDADQPAPASFA